MKKIIVLFCVLFICFGFSDKENLEIENFRIEENCCEFNFSLSFGRKLLPPTYNFYKHERKRISDEQISMLHEFDAKKDSMYVLRYYLMNANGYLDNTVSVFLLNENNDTLVNTFLNNKKYDGVFYPCKKNEKLRFYVNPHENPLLLQKHKRKDKCAKVRCIDYVIGTRTVTKED